MDDITSFLEGFHKLIGTVGHVEEKDVKSAIFLENNI
jgi:hypothetical protein